MRPAEIEIRFYDTYYFANVVKNILDDQFAYIRNLNDFYGNEHRFSFVRPFPRYSALHSFLEFIVDDLLSETGDVNLERCRNEASNHNLFTQRSTALLPVNRALVYYGIPHTPFTEYLEGNAKSLEQADLDDVDEYYSELRLGGSFGGLVDRAVDEVFYIIFSNRRLLLAFNDMVSRQIGKSELSDVPEEEAQHFARGGVLRRVDTPQWAKDAVFFRDRGRCVICRCDLSGLVGVGSDKNFDHVIPLAKGGLNDVTNLQLLCELCNSKKSGGDPLTSDFYQAWYDIQTS